MYIAAHSHVYVLHQLHSNKHNVIIQIIKLISNPWVPHMLYNTIPMSYQLFYLIFCFISIMGPYKSASPTAAYRLNSLWLMEVHVRLHHSLSCIPKTQQVFLRYFQSTTTSLTAEFRSCCFVWSYQAVHLSIVCKGQWQYSCT